MPSEAWRKPPVARTLVKICGLKSREHVEASSEAGATAIGFMFAPSKRRIEVEAARSIAAVLPANHPDLVGVFVNADVGEMNTICQEVGLDVIQLSGDEHPDILTELEGRVWKGIRLPVGTTLDEAHRSIEPWLSSSRPVEALLIDAAVAGAYGGTGHRADWELAAQLAADYPVILAGGLNPHNVEEAIQQVKPLGVDVSSGVEREGTKASDLIRAFVVASCSATP